MLEEEIEAPPFQEIHYGRVLVALNDHLVAARIGTLGQCQRTWCHVVAGMPDRPPVERLIRVRFVYILLSARYR